MILTALQYTKLFSLRKFSGLLVSIISVLISLGATPVENLSLPNPSLNASITSVTGTSPLCVAATAVYSANGVVLDGGSGAWSSSNSAVATVDPSTGFVTAVAGGTCNIIYTITGGVGGTVIAQQPLTVNPLPVPTITGNSSSCAGATSIFYSTEIGMTGYNWSVSSGGTITSGAGTSSITVNWNTVGAQNVSVNYTNTNSCTAASPTVKSVQVHALPVPTITGLASVCNGATGVIYQTESSMTGYIWTISSGGTITSGAGTNSITVNWNALGAQDVSVNYTNANSCTAASPTVKSVTVNALPVPTISGLASVCAGTIGVTYQTEGAMTGYTWSVSSGGTITSGPGTNSITVNWNAAGAQNVSVNYTNTNSCAAVSPTVKSVNVNALPGPTISGLASVCAGSTGVIYQTEGSMSGYIWTISSGGTITSGAGTNSITVNWNTVGAQNVSVNYMNANSCTAASPTVKSVTVNALPAPTINGLASVCAGSTGMIYQTEGSMTGYTWNISAGGTIASGAGTNSISVNWNTAGAQNVSVNYTNGSSCMAAIPTVKNVTVNPLPAAAGSIFGNSTVCQGKSSVLYTVPSITNATGYTWTYSGTGATIDFGQGTNSILLSFSASATSGVLSVFGTNTCGAGSTAVYPIIVSLLPGAAGTINGTSPVCQGSTQTFSVPAISNAASYTWQYSGTGATINGTTNPVTITFSTTASAGNLTVMGTNPCGNGAVSLNCPVTINLLPTTPSDIVPPAASTVCQGSNGLVYSVSPIPNATRYDWAYTGTGHTITNGAPGIASINFSSTASNGDLTVKGHNACGDGPTSAISRVNVNPLPGIAGLINGTSTTCQGQTSITYSVAPISNATTYVWSYSGTGATITGNSTSVTVDFSTTATPGNLTVLGRNSCGDGVISPDYPINLGLLPADATSPNGISPVCQSQAGTITYSVSPISGATSYVWVYSGTGVTFTSPTLTPNINLTFTSIATPGNLTVYGTNACGNGSSATYAIVVNPLPGTPQAINGPPSVCAGQVGVPYTVPAITNALTYDWTYSGTGATITGTSRTPTISFSNTATSGNLTVRGRNNCVTPGVISANCPINVISTQLAPTVYAGGSNSICEGTTLYSINDATFTNATLAWSSSGTGTFINQTAINPTYFPSTADFAAGSVTLTLTGTAISPCTSSVVSTQILTLQKKPVVQAGPGAQICKGSMYTTNGATAVDYSTTKWTTAGDGAFANDLLITTIYTPGTNDIANGGVILKLRANSISPCGGFVEDTFFLQIVPFATASAGSNASICSTGTYAVSGATATNYSLLTWSTTGSGTFSDAHVLSPVYTPSATDISFGSVTLTLTATPNAPCASPVSSTMLLTINPIATVEAGPSGTVCQSGSYTTNGATAVHASTISWSTNGTGTFDDSHWLQAVYHPSAEDVIAGSVILTLKATSAAPCAAPVEDFLVLTVTPIATVNAGPDGLTCGNTDFAITQSTQSNASSVLWTTSGTGTFSNPTQLRPTYSPSANDVSMRSVALTLTGTSGTSCVSAPSDFLVLTISSPVTANAGSDASICEGSNYHLSGTAPNATSMNWISSGTGIFINGNTPTPDYIPSADDILAGSVTLTFQAGDAFPCFESSDQLILNILKKPVVSVGPNANVCTGSNFPITLTRASNWASVHWTSSGSGTHGTFSNPDILLPVYFPSTDDIAAGSVVLKLTVQPVSPCSAPVSAEFTLTFVAPPTANAGPDATICQTQTGYTISGASSNSSIVNWTSSGTGTFVSNATLTPTYFPSPSDISAGSVTLTLHATGTAPCADATDNMILSIAKTPAISAGSAASVCQGSSFTVSDASASNYSTLIWTHNGLGSLANQTTLAPTYIPAVGEIGSVTLTLTANAISPCTLQVFSTKIITIQGIPAANAGPDAQVCEPNAYTIIGATEANAGVLNWTSSGTGTFAANGTLAPTYNPSAADYASGQVTLTLHASGINSCNSTATDNMLLRLIPLPSANAGIDAVICQGGSYTVSGASVANASSYRWTASGSGSLSYPTSPLSPVYSASAGETGNVTLTLTARPNSPCAADAVDQMVISIQPSPTANAGLDASTCQGTSFTLSGIVTNSSSYAWSTSGSGAFTGIGTLSPKYTPSAADAIAGSVTFTLTAVAKSPCTSNVSDVMILTVFPLPAVNAGSDATICASSSYDLSLASTPATNSNTISTLWSTSGDGTFFNTGLLHPIYTPGPGDIASGQSVLTLTGQPFSSCGSLVRDAMVLTISNTPTADAGPPTISICKEAYTITGATATNYSSVHWSGGSGSITNENSLTPTYTPSASEIASGSVTLTLTVTGGASCGGVATDTITLLIKPSTPNISVLGGNSTTFCEGNSITLAGAPSGYNYRWTPGGTSAQNKVVTASGSYSVVITDPVTGCSSPQSNVITVTVNPSPKLSSPLTLSPNCSGNLITYSPSSATPGTSFSWTRPIVSGISPAQSSGGNGINPNEILINATSNPITVTYLYTLTTNGCTNYQNVTVDVGPTPVLTSSLTPSSICSNTPFSYIPESPTVGTVFAWRRDPVPGISNPSTSGLGNPNETLTNITNLPINVVYFYTLTANGCANPTPYNVTVTVNPAPSLSSSLSPPYICSGNIFNYSATSTTSGVAMTWTRPTVTGISPISSSGSGSINEFLSSSAPLPVNVTYQYVLYANGCTTNQNVVVSVKPAPVLTSSLNPAAICSGNSFVYNATTLTPSTSFSWTRLVNPNIAEPVSPAGTTSVINETLTNLTLAPVNVTYNITLTAGGCPSPSSYFVNVIVNPKPQVPIISPASPINFCAGGNVVLTSTSSNSYQWSTGEVTQSITASSSGSYFVIVRDANGCQSAQSTSVIVNALSLPTIYAGNDGVVCAGNSFTVSGATAINSSSYGWSSSGTGTFQNQGTLAPTYVPSVLDQTNGSVVLTLTAFGNAPCTASVNDFLQLTIQPKPTANAGPDQSVCYPNSLVITGATSTHYQSLVWTHDGTGVMSSLNSLTPTYIPGSGDVGRTVTVTLTANSVSPCNVATFSTMHIVVGSMPGNPGVITGSATVCKPSSFTYSIVPIAGVTTYNWSVPPGASIISGANTNVIRVTFPSGSSSGDLSVYGTNSCGNGPISTMAIQVNDVPANPGSISGTSSVCQGKTGIVYSVAAVTGATSYTWTVPTGATINGASTGSSITVDYGSTAISGNVVVFASNTCGVGTSSTKAITVNVKPTAPVISAASGQLTTFCEGGNVWLNGPNLGTGYNYLWSPYGATSQNNLVTAGGTYRLTVTNSLTGCSSDQSNSIPVTVNPAPTPPVSIGYITYCWDGTGAPPVLNANNVTTVPPTSTLTWYDAPLGGNVVVAPTNNKVGTINAVIYYAESTDIISGCKSLTRTPVKLTIVQNPSTPVNGPNQIACEQSPIQTLTATTLTPPPAGTSIVWYTSPIGGAPVTPTLNTVGNRIYYAEANNGTCPSLTRSPGVSLTIQGAPVAPTSGGNITQCVDNITGNKYTATATSPAGTSVTWWNQSAGGNTVVPSLFSNIAGTATYYAESKDDLTNCTSLTRTAVTITIVDYPTAPTTTGDQVGCQRATVLTLTASATAAAGSTLRWFATAAGGTPITGAPTLNAVGTITYYAESYIAASGCASLTRTPVKLTINPAPVAPTSSIGNITQCATLPTTQTLTASATPPSGSTLAWYTTATGGTPVSPATWDQVGATSYYAESIDNIGCVSTTRTRVILTINNTPDAPVPLTPSANDPTFGEVIQCEQSPIQTLTATAAIPATAPVGTTIRWYTTPTGGTVLAANAQIRRTVGTSTYYAESYIAAGTCPSLTRTKVVLTINPAPAAPTSIGNPLPQCAGSKLDAGTQINTPSGTSIVWYNSLTLGDIVYQPTLSDVNTVTYYAESTNILSGCVSLRRTAVTLSIKESPAPLDSLTDITECAATPLQTLNVPIITPTDGSLVRWFTVRQGGTAVLRPTLSSTVKPITYYAEAYKGTCVSPRRQITLTINALPVAPISLGNVTVCSTDTVLDANKRIALTPLTPKVGVEWFTLASGGTAVSPRWNTVGPMTYYAEALDSVTGCRSARRTAVTLTINAAPLPLDKIPEIKDCAQSPLQTLNVPTITPSDGSLVRWFSTATGGAAIARPTLNAVRSTTFYAEAYKGTCVSPTRLPVTLTINPSPAVPVSRGNLTVCSIDTVLDANTRIVTPLAAKVGLEWFTAATGGTAVSPRWNTVGSMTYYAEALDSIAGCRSTRRTAVTLTINAAPLPLDKIKDVTECATSPLQTLNVPTIIPADGSLIRWFSAPTGGTAIARPTLSSTAKPVTYYAEAYKGSCVLATRMPVTLTINTPPAIPLSLGNLTVCATDTTLDANKRIAAPVPATPNVGLEWFTTATGGTPVSPTWNTYGSMTFYAEAKDLTTECRSTRRTPVTLTINETPAPPVGKDIIECVGKTIQTLTAKVTVPTGVTVTWWSAATGGTIVTNPVWNTVGTAKSYYAEARLGNCVSTSRTKVTLMINPSPANPTYINTTTGIIAPVCEPDSVDASKWVKPGTVTSKLSWYDALTLGNAVSAIQKAPATRIVYAESVDSISGCPATKRIPVTMTVNTQAPPTLAAKYANGVIKECALPKVQTLNARNALNITAGLTLIWYDKPIGGVKVANPTWSTVNDSITYYAAYQKPGGCESALRTPVKLMITSPLVSTSSNSPLAIGQDLKLFGGAEVFGYTYVWTDPRKFTYTGMDQLIPNVTSAMGGMYKLTVTDPSGCSASDSTRVTITSAKASYQQTCLGGTLYLSGLPDNMVYSWKGPNNFSSTEQSPAINNVTAAMAGKYKLQVIDPSGTTSADSITVAFKALPIPLISVATICPAGTLQLSGNPSGMVSYTWTGPGGATIPSDPKNPRNLLPLAYPLPTDSTRYTLTVRDQNGCEATTSVIPTVFSPKATYNAPLCSGDTLKLRGEPSNMASYSWRDPLGALISTLQSPIIKNVTLAGTYTLTVRDKAGCNFPPTPLDVQFSTPVVKPIITITPNPACEGMDITLRASPSGMNTYEWAGPNGFTSTDQNPVLTYLKPVNAGTYSLKVTNGCASYANPVTLSVNSVNFVGTYGPYCISDSKVTLITTPAGVIFTGPGITGNVFDPASAGVGVHNIQYTLNTAQCTVSSFMYPQIEVYVKPTLVVNPAALVLKTCTGTTADLTLPAVTAGSSTGLTLSYWKDSKASITLTTPKAVTAGTYYIKGLSKSGKCFDIQAAFVSQPDSLRATMTPLAELSCAGDTTGSMTVNVTYGSAPYNYLWSTKPVQSTQTAKNLKAGIYTVVVTDAKKCIASFTGEIKEPAPIRLGFRTKAVQCMSDANGSASVDTINGSTDLAVLNSYKYKWLTNPVQTTREALRLTPLWHRITVTDPNSCVKKDSVFISVTDTMRPLITCPRPINLTVEYLKTGDLNPNKYIVDLGKPLVWDNCSVIDTMVLNDAPIKFRTGETLVKWTVTDQVGLINACIQKVYIKEIPLIPQMISPNGDRLNDKFVIDGLTQKEYRDSQLLIFTRSGQLVFQSNNYEDPANAWDGKYTESTFSKNQLVAPGVYYYILKLGGTSSQTLRGYVYVYY
ncbi:MAG: gliding motility-associated C-terminal domain-containing protein [Prolixibacteraceae bacterium]